MLVLVSIWGSLCLILKHTILLERMGTYATREQRERHLFSFWVRHILEACCFSLLWIPVATKSASASQSSQPADVTLLASKACVEAQPFETHRSGKEPKSCILELFGSAARQSLQRSWVRLTSAIPCSQKFGSCIWSRSSQRSGWLVTCLFTINGIYIRYSPSNTIIRYVVC